MGCRKKQVMYAVLWHICAENGNNVLGTSVQTIQTYRQTHSPTQGLGAVGHHHQRAGRISGLCYSSWSTRPELILHELNC